MDTGIKALLLVLLFSAVALAEPLWVRCPYETVDRARVLSIDTLSPAIRSDRGIPPSGRQEPWAEQEIADNEAVVFTDVSASVRTQILSTEAGGGKCSLLTREVLDTDLAKPETERTVLRQRRDTRGREIAPIRSRALERLETRIARTQTTQRTLWETLKQFWVGIAYALGIFPDSTVLIDDFNRANESPLGGEWTQFDPLSTTGNILLTSNQAVSSSGGGSAYYNVRTCDADCDAYVTLSGSGIVSTNIWMRLTDFGTNGDGYRIRATTTNGNIYRLDNGVATQLGAACTTTIALTDAFGARTEGGNISSYLNNTLICTRADATYSASGHMGIGLSTTNEAVDNVFLSAFVDAKRNSVLWRLLQ